MAANVADGLWSVGDLIEKGGRQVELCAARWSGLITTWNLSIFDASGCPARGLAFSILRENAESAGHPIGSTDRR